MISANGTHDATWTRTADLVRELVNIPSINPAYGPDATGESDIAEAVGAMCRQAGCTVQTDTVIDGRPNVLARLAGTNARSTVAIEAHLDTVGRTGECGTDARIDGDRMFGRGTCDTKGGLAAAIAAIRRLAVRRPSNIDIILVGAIDEEHRFRGVTHYLANNPAPGAAIVIEPTELEVVNEHNGVLRLQIAVSGIASHTSVHSQGRNAIRDVNVVIDALDTWHSRTSTGPAGHRRVWTPTLIDGGRAINIVPDRCLLDIDVRLAPDEEPDSARAGIASELESLELSQGVRATISAVSVADRGLSTNPDAPLVRQALLAASRSSAQWVPFGTDASKFSRAGVPSIVFGPGSIDDAHSDHESVSITDVLRAEDILVDLIGRLDTTEMP